VDEASSGTTSLTIAGEATDNAGPFTSAAANVSSRRRTSAAVPWVPVAWSTVGQAGAAQRTPDLTAVLGEIVGRSGWVSGNSVVLIVTGSGKRVAKAYDGAPVDNAKYEESRRQLMEVFRKRQQELAAKAAEAQQKKEAQQTAPEQGQAAAPGNTSAAPKKVVPPAPVQ